MTGRPPDGVTERVGRRDRGMTDALGLVLIAPAVIGLAVLVIALGRGVDARAQVRSAAEAGAQAAAQQRDQFDAEIAARRVIDTILTPTTSCAEHDVTVRYPVAPEPGSGISAGLVSVDVVCLVSDQGIEVIQAGAREERVTAVAGVDFFRGGARP